MSEMTASLASDVSLNTSTGNIYGTKKSLLEGDHSPWH
jgi:hypothetical protein